MKILNSFKSDEIEYGPVVKNLNWFKHPAKPVPPQVVRVSKTKDRLLRFRENNYNFVLTATPMFKYFFILLVKFR